MRTPDKLRIEVTQDAQGNPIAAPAFDAFTSAQVTQDITAPFEASFEVGDDESWRALEQLVLPGAQYSVFVNDQIQLTGRVETADVPIDTSGGASVRYVVRTKLSDAQYASADHTIRFKDTSVKEFILALYEPLEVDTFWFMDAASARDLMTGRTSERGTVEKVDLEELKEEQAKVQPGETIFAAADRHLRRHGLMHWDAPDGGIVISKPDDKQNPTYFLRSMRGSNGVENNIIGATRTRDFAGIPTTLSVYGTGGKRDFTKSKVQSFVQDDDAIAAGFYRPVVVVAEGLKTQDRADKAALREKAARSQRKDAWEVEVDGLSHWTGNGGVPYAVDHVAAVQCDVAGGPLGAYYLHRVVMKLDPRNGMTTTLGMVRRGIWVL